MVGFDKHDRGAFNPQPADWGLDDWYGETGLMLTTQYFGMKIQRYMHDHGISRETLLRVAEKAFRNGSRPRPPGARRRCRGKRSTMHPWSVSRSTNICSAHRLRRLALIVCLPISLTSFIHARHLKTAVVRSRNYGSLRCSACPTARGCRFADVTASQAAFELAGVGPEDIDVAQLQDTEVGAEIMHMARTAFVITASRSNGWPTGN